MGDILDLLRQDEIEKHALRLGERVEIGLADLNERLHTGQPRRRRSVHHMWRIAMRARRGDDAEQPGRLEVDAAAFGADAAEKFQAGREC